MPVDDDREINEFVINLAIGDINTQYLIRSIDLMVTQHVRIDFVLIVLDRGEFARLWKDHNLNPHHVHQLLVHLDEADTVAVFQQSY